MDDQQEMLLELIEKSVRVIPLDKEDWEKKAGLAPFIADDDDKDSLITATTETDLTDTNPDARTAALNGSVCSVASDYPLIYPTMNNLRKACLATPPSNALSPGTSSSPRTQNNRKTLNRKTLIAAVEKWITQNHAKSQKDRACPCVKVLSSSRLKEEVGSDTTNPKHLLDSYVRNERAADPSIHDRTKKTPDKLVAAMYPERDPSRSLLLRCNNTLVDGEVHSENSADAVARTGSNNSLLSGMTAMGGSSSPSRTAILRCAASLYYRIWYFRAIRKKDLRRAFGFALASSVSGSGSRTRVSLRVTFLMLEKPSDTLLNSSPIGGRYPLYVYKKRYDLPRERDSLKESAPSSTRSLPSYSCTVLEELADFLFRQTETLPCPFRHTASLPNILSSPGGMLLPDEPFHQKETNGNNQSSSNSMRSTVVPMHLMNGCRIVPTITGSLVIHCRNARAVRELLERSGPNVDEKEDDRNGIRQLIKSFTIEANNSHHASSWYVKYKTPSFGFVWENSRIAINGPRGGLKRKHSSKSSSSSSQNASVRRWAFLHPIDSWVGAYRCITITRSAGVEFEKAVDDYGLSWAGFQREFLGLAKSTLELQKHFNSLVHGDIHEGNVLYYPPFHNEDGEAKLMEDNGESESLFPSGHRLVLIDWDEASRPKPFRRSAITTEARMRYPDSLYDFPKQYTQQQLMHLFAILAEKYYPSETEKVISGEDADNPDCAWMRSLLVPPSPPSTRASTNSPYHQSAFAKFLSRSAVEKRYMAMLRGLQGECWWSMNWGESGLDDGSYHIPKGSSSSRLNGGGLDVRRSTRW